MGYTTQFKGAFSFDREIAPELEAFINNFAASRHVKRDVEEYKRQRSDWKSRCFNGNLGKDGEFIVDYSPLPLDVTYHNIPSLGVTEYNTPPGDCPGLWCQWVVVAHKYLTWDGGEKFYNYERWLRYLIEHFIAPSGYVLNGNVAYWGENEDDFGVICVDDNEVTVKPGAQLSETDQGSNI